MVDYWPTILRSSSYSKKNPMKEPSISVYSNDKAFLALFVARLAKQFPLRPIYTIDRLSSLPCDLPAGVRPSLIFMDLSRPNLYSKIHLSKLNRSFPQAELMVLVSDENPSRIFEFIQAGATGYLLKGGWQEDLSSLLSNLEEQKALISPKIARFLIEKIKCP
jgi:DNA-binding NarL/FixJ family response regulator